MDTNEIQDIDQDLKREKRRRRRRLNRLMAIMVVVILVALIALLGVFVYMKIDEMQKENEHQDFSSDIAIFVIIRTFSSFTIIIHAKPFNYSFLLLCSNCLP